MTRTGAALLLLALSGAGCGGDEPEPVDDSPFVEELGPYEVDGVEYTVELSAVRAGASQSVVRMRVLDPSGAVHVDEEYPNPFAAGAQPGVSRQMRPAMLVGDSASILLVIREETPAAPMTGTAYHLYGPRDGRLTALTVPFAPYGEIPTLAGDGEGARRLEEGDFFQVDTWRYHYGLTVPVAVDLACEPGSETCLVVSPDSLEPASGYGLYPVRTELRPVEQGGAVQLHETPGSEAVLPVAVRAGTEVEVHEAAADIRIGTGRQRGLEFRAEWLRVTIDGRAGWVTGPATFELIGLPPSG